MQAGWIRSGCLWWTTHASGWEMAKEMGDVDGRVIGVVMYVSISVYVSHNRCRKTSTATARRLSCRCHVHRSYIKW